MTGNNESGLSDAINFDPNNIPPANDSDISKNELELLDNAGLNQTDNNQNATAEVPLLNGTDDDGEMLNEEIDITGEDLDVPGSELDDENELIGEEDPENNSYSERDQDDDAEEGF